MPAAASRTLGADLWRQPCCAGPSSFSDCPEASAAHETRAALRWAFSRAQHLLYYSGTFVTDACSWPQRASDALSGRAAAFSAATRSRASRAGVFWLQEPLVVSTGVAALPSTDYVSGHFYLYCFSAPCSGTLQVGTQGVLHCVLLLRTAARARRSSLNPAALCSAKLLAPGQLLTTCNFRHCRACRSSGAPARQT